MSLFDRFVKDWNAADQQIVQGNPSHLVNLPGFAMECDPIDWKRLAHTLVEFIYAGDEGDLKLYEGIGGSILIELDPELGMEIIAVAFASE